MRPLLLLAAIFSLACDSSSDVGVQNPTGDCRAPLITARAGYDDVSPGATWLPDCQNPVAREYWRVYARSADSAYMLPRPDGDPNLVAACNNAAHPLHALVESYFLCSPATTPETVSRTNDMLAADALQIAHDLHAVFAFENDAGAGVHIAPFPIPGDILDACALHPQESSADLAAICAREQERLQSGYTIGFTYDGPGAVELVARLNELYGIACPAGLIPATICECGPDDGCVELSRACRPACQASSDCLDPAQPMCTNGYCNQLCG